MYITLIQEETNVHNVMPQASRKSYVKTKLNYYLNVTSFKLRNNRSKNIQSSQMKIEKDHD